MYRNQEPKQDIVFLSDSAGIGDVIGTLPVFKWILDNHPHVTIHYVVPSFIKTVVRKSLPKCDRFNVYDFSETNKIKPNLPIKKFAGCIHTNLATHQTVQAYSILANTQPLDVNAYSYLSIDLRGVYINRFNLPEKYVVLTCGFTSDTREFKPETVNQVIDYVISRGYIPVFLGREVTAENNPLMNIKGQFKSTINYDKGINLINKTDLLETTKIIKESACIVGLDNGLLHLAGTTDVAIVGSFSSVNPIHRLPYRHGVMGWNYYPVTLSSSELKCIHCQSNMVFNPNQEFTQCRYNDYKCLDLLNSSKYIEQLEKIL